MKYLLLLITAFTALGLLSACAQTGGIEEDAGTGGQSSQYQHNQSDPANVASTLISPISH